MFKHPLLDAHLFSAVIETNTINNENHNTIFYNVESITKAFTINKKQLIGCILYNKYNTTITVFLHVKGIF